MEKDLWATMRDHVKTHGHFERIENMVGRGRPDVNYCVRGVEGNIELKQIRSWPALPDTVVKIEHFSPQQRNWLRTRTSAGGRVYVLLQVVEPVPYYGLFDGMAAVTFLGKFWTQANIRARALAWGEHTFPTDRILRELTHG